MLRRAGGRARDGTDERIEARAPRSRPHAHSTSPTPTSTPRSADEHAARSDDEIGDACCSTSASRAASATSTRARCCSPAASNPFTPVGDVDAGDRAPRSSQRRRQLLRANVGRRAPAHDARRRRGVRPRAATVPALRHADPSATPGRAGPHHVLVPALSSADWCRDAVSSRTVVDRSAPASAGWPPRRRLDDAPVARHDRRPAQLPHVPAAALPSRDRRPERRRRRVRRARHLPRPAQRDVPAARRSPASTGTRTRVELDDGDDARVRPPRRRRRRDRGLLRHPRRGGARLPAVLARSTPSRCATTSSTASRRPMPTRRLSTMARSRS